MVIFLGAPGSGKGTQSRILAKNDGYSLFAVGEILRKEIVNKTEYGMQIESALKRGEFANLDIVIALLKQNVMHSKFILDGFPRNLAQAMEFEKFIDSHDNFSWNRLVAIDFVVPHMVLLERLYNRRLCKICDGALPMYVQECIFCGHYFDDFYIREDDNSQAIEHRLKIFYQENDKLIEFFKKKNIYYPIDATKGVEDVYCTLKSVISSCECN